MSAFENLTQSSGGKAAIAVVAVIALGLIAYEVMQMGATGQSRDVPAKQVVSEAQQQIDAINKMTNISPQQKQAMIAHEQEEIDRANGKGGAAKTPTQGEAKTPTQG